MTMCNMANTDKLVHMLKNFPETPRMPALFVGHGSPMNAIEDNRFVEGWKKLGKTLPRPVAILSISAHWLTRGTEVHMSVRPRTIYDFGGFPEELYQITYPCPGSPIIADATQKVITITPVTPNVNWGLDHGTWVVLRHMYPNAHIPVFQLSLDVSASHRKHYEIGKQLSLLRKRGVLIIGSGNLVHNLREVDLYNQSAIFPWAEDFDNIAKELITSRNHSALINYEKLGTSALRSIPTPDHFWPLLYILGLQVDDDVVTFPIEGITLGSISMRSVLIG